MPCSWPSPPLFSPIVASPYTLVYSLHPSVYPTSSSPISSSVCFLALPHPTTKSPCFLSSVSMTLLVPFLLCPSTNMMISSNGSRSRSHRGGRPQGSDLYVVIFYMRTHQYAQHGPSMSRSCAALSVRSKLHTSAEPSSGYSNNQQRGNAIKTHRRLFHLAARKHMVV